MSGIHRGVQARLKQRNPSALYVPCSNHSLDLVLQEASREVLTVAGCLQFVKDAANTINESAKRTSMYKSTFEDQDKIYKLLGICATRWCVRAAAIKRVIQQYPHVRETLEMMKTDKSLRGETRAKVAGLCRQADDSATYVALCLVLAIYEPCEMVAASLQSASGTSGSALQSINLLKGHLHRLRAGALKSETLEAAEKASDLGLVATAEKRATKTPGRLRHDGTASADMVLRPEEAVRTSVLEALDLMISQLDERFNTPGLQLAARREEALLSCLDPKQQTPVSCDELQLPSSVFSEDCLRCEASVLSQSFKARPVSPAEVLSSLKSLGPSAREMFGETVKLTSLVMSVPSSVAAAERSFSMLRRLKTYLRNRMGQARLTNLALMHMYGAKLTPDVMRQLAQRFVEATPERRRTFGSL